MSQIPDAVPGRPNAHATISGNSLYCALEKATSEVTGHFAHRGAAMQEARCHICATRDFALPHTPNIEVLGRYAPSDLRHS
jgi:hypothetical protein